MSTKMSAEEVKELRKKLGLTQPQLAEKVGVDVGTVSRWERKQQRPSQLATRVMLRLANKKGGRNDGNKGNQKG